MIGKKEAIRIAQEEGQQILTKHVGDNKLYAYVIPNCDDQDYFSDIRELIFEWEDRKDQKQRVLVITENNIDFLDASTEAQDAYRRYYKIDED